MILEIALFPLPSPLSSPPPLFCSSSFEADTVGRREGKGEGGSGKYLPPPPPPPYLPSPSVRLSHPGHRRSAVSPSPFSCWHRFLPCLPSPSRSNTFPYVPTCRLWYLRPSLPLAPLSFLVPSSPTQFFFSFLFPLQPPFFFALSPPLPTTFSPPSHLRREEWEGGSARSSALRPTQPQKKKKKRLRRHRA